MPIINVQLLKGRPAETTARFARAVTDATVDALGVKREQVRVIIHEVEPEHWFVAGEAKAPPA